MMTSCSAGGSLEKTYGKLRASFSVGMITLTFGQGISAKVRGSATPSPGSRRSNSGPVNHESSTVERCSENRVAKSFPPTMIALRSAFTGAGRHSPTTARSKSDLHVRSTHYVLMTCE